MDVKTWTTISRLLDDALDLLPGARADWLDALGPEHESLKPRLRELLAQAAAMDRDVFLATLPKVELGGSGAADDGLRAPDEPRTRAGTAIGPYRLVRLIASGGQGAVWLAERADGLVNRPVALKLPHGLAFRPGLAERMARERDILAALNHPHISRLYDAGVTPQGEPYLALEYVDGSAIDQHCRDRGLSVPDRVRLFLQVVRAVAYAHGQLVIHRDLKPSNILVTAEGYVRLLDFGIAKLLAADAAVDSTLTIDAGRALTLPYASPEQVLHEPLGVATDIYSLGVVLYELLAGARPHRPARESAAALEDAILSGDVARPSDVAPTAKARKAIAGDLDTIVLKALKRSAHERYATADAVADDLERALDGRPVLAQPDSRRYRLKKFVVRHRVGVASAAAVLVAILGGAGAALWQAEVARAEQRRAEEVKDFITALLQDANPDSASPSETTVLELLKHADERLQSRPSGAVKAELLIDVGNGLLGLGDTDTLESVAARAVAEATAASDRHLVYRARVLSAYAHWYRGRPDAMAADVDAVLPFLEQTPDGYARELAVLWRLRASAAIEAGRYADAVVAAERAVPYAVAALGANSQLHMEVLKELAVAQNRRGTPADALETVRRAIEIADVVYRDNPGHPVAISVRGTYADALGDTGQVADAITHMERVVADATRVFGTDGRTVAFHLQRLANFQIRLGRLDAAIGNITRALAIIERHADPASGTVAAFRNTAGTALNYAHRGAEAAPYLRGAFETAARAFGGRHANTLNTRASYAFALHLAGRSEEARREIAATVAEMRAGKPLVRPLLVGGTIARRDGQLEAAVPLFDEAEQAAGDDRVLRWQILAQRGLSKVDARRPPDAIADLERAVAIIDELRLEAMPDVIAAVDGLGRALVAVGRTADATPHVERARRWRAAAAPSDRARAHPPERP